MPQSEVKKNYYSPNNIKNIEIILKTAERCNINCTYCYFFNGGDTSYHSHPPYISFDTIKSITHFLKKGVKELGLESIMFDFHGGEPLMQKKKKFDEMCEYITNELSDIVTVEFGLQTNAMLIDSEWIGLFAKHKVAIGASLDGPKKYNDIARIDHKDGGTYDRVIAGLKILKNAADKGTIVEPGLLCVVNPDYSVKDIYNHFIHDLDFKMVDFLLPDINHDTFTENNADKYGKYLCELMDLWTNEDKPEIFLRFVKSFIIRLLGVSTNNYFAYATPKVDYIAFTISSDGCLSPDDTLRTTKMWNLLDEPNVKNTTLTEFLSQDIFYKMEQARTSAPDSCSDCCWEYTCGGGALVNRYSSKTKNFNQPTIYCDGLKKFYSHVTAYLLDSGISYDVLEKNILSRPNF